MDLDRSDGFKLRLEKRYWSQQDERDMNKL